MGLSTQEKKELKAKRVREVFAYTAKEMILEEGVLSVSVRKVADRAGYALGTVYNHFSNLDALLWETRELMIMDLATYMIHQNDGEINALTDIKKIFRHFMNYFIDNPNIYRFFYYHSLRKTDKPNSNVMDDPEIRAQFGKTYDYLLAHCHLSEEEVALRTRLVVYTMFGMMTLYITNNDNTNLETIYQQLDAIIDRMFVQ